MNKQKILCHFALAALAAVCLPRPAKASFIINIAQSGPDVVATGSGSLNVSGLTNGGTHTSVINGFIGPSGDVIELDTTGSQYTAYNGSIAIGPSNLGPAASGPFTTSFTGDVVGIQPGLPGVVVVPDGYASGSALSDSATWAGTTIAGLGLTPGTYVYSWGTGPSADTLTLNVTAPEPGSMALIALGGLGLAGFAVRGRSRRRIR